MNRHRRRPLGYPRRRPSPRSSRGRSFSDTNTAPFPLLPGELAAFGRAYVRENLDVRVAVDQYLARYRAFSPASYPTDAEIDRRLRVKPGLTGLWQVSGRSDLPWDESLRLDLRYVDNWSMFLDLQILWRTVRAVIRGTGAY